MNVPVHRAPRRRLSGGLAFALALGLLAAPAPRAEAQSTVPPGCTIGALNRSVRVDALGRWVLSNVPANRGLVRARAVCVENGVVRTGQSELFAIVPNGLVQVPSVSFDAPVPVPRTVALEAPTTPFRAPGEHVQLRLLARYVDGTSADVTGRQGIFWTSSNPRVVAVNTLGMATSMSSGVALVTALFEGVSGTALVRVELAGDSDGDGIPDDVEIAAGLDPNSPADGFEDADSDALSNRDELAVFGTDPRRPDSDLDTIEDGEEARAGADGYVTNPLAADTDGDRFRDALEIQTGSDPTRATSYNLAAATASVRVAPADFELRIDSLFGAASTTRQLAVTAVLRDGVEIDVTSPTWGTNYTSPSPQCRVDPDGVVVPVSAGICAVYASVGSKTGSASARVLGNPGVLATLDLPGFANSVAVRGDYAFVAAGPAGLVVVDVADRRLPRVVAQLALPGNGNDLRLSGDYAFVAADTAKLHVVDLSNPLAPARVATLDTQGLAIDIALDGGYAYIADGAAGLAVIDVSSPLAPVFVGALDTPGSANGVDAAGGLAVVTDLSGLSRVIDVSNPASPLSLATIPFLPFSVRGFDVQLKLPLVYLAESRGLHAVDLSVPASPVDLGPSGSLFLTDLALDSRGLMFATAARPDTPLGLFDASRAGVPAPLGELVLSDFGAGGGDSTGIAVDGRFFYATASRGFEVAYKPGYTGATRLYLGTYADFSDAAGVPPAVSFSEPAEGATATVGRSVRVNVLSVDDVATAEVRLARNGVPVGADGVPPYLFEIVPQAGETEIELVATATDFGGNVGQATLVVPVVADSAPSVSIVRPAEGETVEEGAQDLVVLALADDDFAVSRLEIRVGGVLLGSTSEGSLSLSYDVPLGAASLSFEATATDDRGQTTTVSRTVGVVPDPAPTVSILMPAAGSSVVAGTVMPIHFTATDDQLPLARLELWVDGVQIAIFAGTPYSATYPVPGGISSLSIEVRATDRIGKTTVAARTVAVIDPPPTVELDSPVAGAELGEGALVNLHAVAADNLGVVSVELRAGGATVLVDTEAPFETPFTVPSGAASLLVEAIATDTAGQTAAVSRTYTVVQNGAPRLTLVRPAAGESWVEGELVTLEATADDIEGIERVELYLDDFEYGTLYSPPYTVDLEVPFGTGSIVVRAVAVDRGGMSSMVERTVPVTADPGTTVAGRVVDALGDPVVGARVALSGRSATADGQGRFEIADVPTRVRSIEVQALFESGGVRRYGKSAATLAVRGGTTDVGDIGVRDLSGGTLVDPENDLRGEDDRRPDLDIRGVTVEPLADAVRIRVALAYSGGPGGGLAPAMEERPTGFDAILAFDLDRDPQTGARPFSDRLGPHRPSGLGADLTLRFDDLSPLDGVPIALDDQGFVVEVPLGRLGGVTDFDLSVAVFDYPFFRSGGGGAFAPQQKSLTEPPTYLTYDVAPDLGRFRLPALPDYDGDTLSDFREAELGTDLGQANTDGDPLNDGFEVLYGFDPLDPEDGYGDRDGDGLFEGTEQYMGTDPNVADTDGDGLSDGAEVQTTDGNGRSTWATEADTDGDGILDSDEAENFANTFDTDRDGLSDGREQNELGTDPDNFDGDGGGAQDGQEVEIDGTSPTAPGDDRQRLLLGGTTLRPRVPSIAIDGAGNVHAAFLAEVFGREQLFYRMLSATGQVLIDSTRLTATLSPDLPVVRIGAGGRVHLAWSDLRFGNAAIFYRVLDPALDDRNGNAADPAAITVVSERQVSPSGSTRNVEPAMAIDGSGDVHLVWADQSVAGLRYARYDAGGAVEVAPRYLFQGGFDGFNSEPKIALDSRGGLHVVWNEATTLSGGRGMVYLLMDAAGGNVLIDATVLSRQDSYANGFARLGIDADDRVTVVYDSDRRNETRILRIAPYRDDLNGDAADFATLLDLPDRSLSFPDFPQGNHPEVLVGADGRVHLLSFEANPWFGNASTLRYQARNEEGEILVPWVPLSEPETATASQVEGAALVSRGNEVWAVWSEANQRLVARRIR